MVRARCRNCEGEPSGEIDHINGDRTDNRICNLRDVTSAGNSCNRRRQDRNTSGVTGVAWDKRASRWQARIGLNGKQKYLGYFDSLDEAVAARKAAELELGFHPNHGRAAIASLYLDKVKP